MKFVLLFIILTGISFANPKFISRVYYNKVSDYDKLHAYDILEYNNQKEKYFLAIVDDSEFQQLKNDGWRVAKDISQSAALPTSAYGISENFNKYKTVSELYQELISITAAYPQITELVDYGNAYCKSLGGLYLTPGNDTQKLCNLLAIKITNKKITGRKPVFFLMAGIHAREITTPEIALRFINLLTQNYETNADVHWLVDYREIWVVPSVNPEGHWLVELGATDKYGNSPFYQRKNANHDDGSTDWPPNAYWYQYGVDLNRNHSYNWGGTGASTNPSEMTFRGRAAASEPEICNLQNLLTNLFLSKRQVGQPASSDTAGLLISLHSYSKLVLWPWAYTSANAPNKTELKMMGDRFADFNKYTSEQSSDLYPTTGDTTDWTYGKLGVPAFTFELGDSFMPSYSEIDSNQWPRNKPALLYAAKIARLPYRLIHGPDASTLSFAPGTGSTVVITAKIDDTKNGEQNIASAQFFIGYPYSSTNYSLFQMLPSDGAFNSNAENVYVEVSATNFFDEEKLIFVRGTDDSGNTGALSAIFSEVVPEPFLTFNLLFFLSMFITFIRFLFYRKI